MSENSEISRTFLSHNSRDKPAVEVIQRLLEHGNLQRGEAPIPCWFDKDDLRSQGTWMSQLEDAVDTCGAAVVFYGPDGRGPVHKYEVELLLKRAMYEQGRDAIRLVLVLLPGTQESAIRGFISLHMWADFRKGLDDAAALQRLRAFILGEAPRSGSGNDPKVPKPEIEPYRGLEPFEGKHAIYFFGRDNEIKELCGRLREWPFTAVIGGSGSGKSSIVRAGLQTELATQERPVLTHTTTITVRPGSSPIRTLADQVAASLPNQSATITERLKLVEDFDQQFRTGSDKLLNALRSLYPKDDQHILLVIDQFEELFTHSTGTQQENREGEATAEPRASDNQQTQFVELLAAVAKSHLDRLRIVITLRADFFDRCLSVPTLKSLIENRTLLLGKLSDDALRTVIEAPAFQVGAYFEKGLVARILKDVENQNGSLPLLQHALKELWEKRRFGFLTDDGYDETGGVEGALKKRANATLQNLSADQREIAKNVFLRLTTLGEGVSDTRRRVRKTELYPDKADPHVIDEVLKGLSSQANRLIVTNEDGTVEVTHEALIQRWDTLKGWLAENRDDKRLHDRLRDAANEWADPQHGRDPSYLLEGGRLDLAGKFDQTHPNMLTALEREFLGASTARREHAKNQKEEAEREKLRQQEALTRAEAARARLAEEKEAEARVNAARQNRLKQVGFVVAGVAVVAAAIAGWQTWSASIARNTAQVNERAAQKAEGEAVLRGYNGRIITADSTWRSDHQSARRILENGPLSESVHHEFSWDYLNYRVNRGVIEVTPCARPEPADLLAVSPGTTCRFAWWTPKDQQNNVWQLLAWEPSFKQRPQILTSSENKPVFLAYTHDEQHLIWAIDGEGLQHREMTEVASRISLPVVRNAKVWTASAKRPEVFWSDGHSVLGFNYEQGIQIATLTMAMEMAPVRKLEVSADGNTLVAAGEKEFAVIRFGEDRNQPVISTVTGEFIAISADGKKYVVILNGTATLLDNERTLAVYHRVSTIFDVKITASFSPDGTLLVIALPKTDQFGELKLCDPNSGALLAQLNGRLQHDGIENFLLTRFIGRGKALVSWSDLTTLDSRSKGILRIWDTRTGGTNLSEVEFAYVKSWATNSQVDRFPNVSSSYGLSQTNTVSLGDNGILTSDANRSTSAAKPIQPPLATTLISAAVSLESGWVACIAQTAGQQSPKAYLRKISDQADWISLEGNLERAQALSFSHNGKWLAIGGCANLEKGAREPPGVVDVWDLSASPNFKPLKIVAERGAVNAVAFSPDEMTLATASSGAGYGEVDGDHGVVRIWDPQTGQLRLTMRGHSSQAIAVAFSPDSKQLISCSRDEALLWNGRPWSFLDPSPSKSQ